MNVMQGDAYKLGVTIKNNAGNPVSPEDVVAVEFTIGELVKRYPDGEVTYANGKWLIPLSQKETGNFWPSNVRAQVRVKWLNGVIEGKRIHGVRIQEGYSKEVL